MGVLPRLMFKWTKRARNVIMWERAITHMAMGRDPDALDILSVLSLPDGFKQIAMVQKANCLSRLRRYSEAAAAYREAAENERDWGKRRNPDDAAYIVRYCHLFEMLIAKWQGAEHADDIPDVYEELLNSKASDELKNRLLPLPLPSEVR